MQVVEKNELEATALEEVGKLKLVVAKVGELGTTDVASRGSLSRLVAGAVRCGSVEAAALLWDCCAAKSSS